MQGAHWTLPDRTAPLHPAKVCVLTRATGIARHPSAHHIHLERDALSTARRNTRRAQRPQPITQLVDRPSTLLPFRWRLPGVTKLVIFPRSSVGQLRQRNGASGGTSRLRRLVPLGDRTTGPLTGCCRLRRERLLVIVGGLGRSSLRATGGGPQGYPGSGQLPGSNVRIDLTTTAKYTHEALALVASA